MNAVRDNLALLKRLAVQAVKANSWCSEKGTLVAQGQRVQRYGTRDSKETDRRSVPAVLLKRYVPAPAFKEGVSIL